jgi:hypothetical protein
MPYLVRNLSVVLISLGLGLCSKEWALFVEALHLATGAALLLTAMPLLAVGMVTVRYLARHPEQG